MVKTPVKIIMCLVLAVALGGASHAPPDPERGKADGACRRDEPGPALIVNVVGLKDRQGYLKLEAYPPNERDFLQYDDILIAQKKVFRRSEIDLSIEAGVNLCIRLPVPGNFAISLLHDRDRNRKFNLASDGVGFGGNPKLGWSKPKAAASSVLAGAGLTRINIVMNYRTGLLSFGPLAP